MGSHLGSSIARLIRRNGKPLSVRRKSGQLDVVTSRRDSAVEMQVETIGFLTRPQQVSAQGDPLSTMNAYYTVEAEPFRDAFEPRDSDLVIDPERGLEARVLSVVPKIERGKLLAFQMFVSGVAA